MRIDDGSGGGYKAKVDENFRLHTESVTRDVLSEAIFKGEAFNFNTGAVTITGGGNEGAIGYFKYNGSDPFVIREILLIVGSASGTVTTDPSVRIYSNPTGGDIVTNAVPIEIGANRDFSSQLQVEGDTFKGSASGTGDSLTGGSLFAESSRSGTFTGVIAFDAGEIILRKGNSLGVTWETGTGSTSQTVKLASTGYILGSDVFVD